ncbi:MAG: gamma-glutamylcyclotransferase [Rhizobiales bacterium]|nr:gamma-glutamylcyclotransferase [Hyphomicrobiales bacterium]MBI3672114.1 gamma-glutamylcyclotransferase [Hyphomicrobiales bacterium]
MAREGEHWVFGYGSLMWRPGFAFVAKEPAVIRGYHRRLCVYSHAHRGTPEVPGLVLGLDHGGSCHGMAYRVDAADWQGTVAYLRAREQVTMVYLEAEKQVVLGPSGRKVKALTYLVDRHHPQYAGALDMGELVRLVRQGRGASGSCGDYVLATLGHLREMGIHDARLEKIATLLKAQAGSSDS